MMKSKFLALLLAMFFCISLASCSENKAKNSSSEIAKTTSQQTTTKGTSQKDLIIGNWVLDDMLQNGKSIMAAEQRDKLSSDIAANLQPIYIYEKDKIKSMIMGEWLISDYIWLDSQKIEITKVEDGTTTKSSFKVEATADKLILSEGNNDTADKKMTIIYKKFKGELPEAMRK